MSANDKAAATYGPGRTTPPLEAQIAEVITEHEAHFPVDDGSTHCDCGQWRDDSCMQDINHRQHVAAMLDPLIAEQQAATLLEAAGDVFDTAMPAEVARWLEARAGKLIGPITGPDCKANKHKACDGRALHEASDSIVACQCGCHIEGEHDARTD